MTILRAGTNIWQKVAANRAAVLIDGAAYYLALREAFLKAEKEIFVLGWDIDSRTRLVGPSGSANDGFPEEFGPFLNALARKKRALRINLLLWDFSFVYALEREPLPMMALQWKTAPNVRLALDSHVPFASSQHQKIVVVDDSVAFSGGLDITIRRWDTSAHVPDNPHRVDPNGVPYKPFHDVQMIVDGPAAISLSRIVKERWRKATDQDLPVAAAAREVWPASVPVDFRDLDVGIARTLPQMGEAPGTTEVSQLFIDSIAAAEQRIYIENQFLTAPDVAHALAARMRERPRLELLCVVPKGHDSWVAETATRNGRIRFVQAFDDVKDRVRFVYACAGSDAEMHTMVHSKVMIVDDRFLRIGSANLNRRSMATDTECDLVIEATTPEQEAAISSVRNRLMADHCATTVEAVEAYARRNPSLLSMTRDLPAGGRRLCDIDDGELDTSGADIIEQFGDPDQPISSWGILSVISGDQKGRRHWPAVILVAALVVGVGLSLLWQSGLMTSSLDPERLSRIFEGAGSRPWTALTVIFAFVLGGLIAFPVNVLIAVTAASFGAVPGFFYAFAGILCSSLATYVVGAVLGRAALERLIGPRLTRLRNRIVAKGVLAVAAIRLVPVAPFTLVNLVAGAGGIPIMDYVLGTLLGMLPGVLILSTLGEQLVESVMQPSLKHLLILAAIAAVWIGFALIVQSLVRRTREPAQ